MIYMVNHEVVLLNEATSALHIDRPKVVHNALIMLSEISFRAFTYV